MFPCSTLFESGLSRRHLDVFLHLLPGACDASRAFGAATDSRFTQARGRNRLLAMTLKPGATDRECCSHTSWGDAERIAFQITMPQCRRFLFLLLVCRRRCYCYQLSDILILQVVLPFGVSYSAQAFAELLCIYLFMQKFQWGAMHSCSIG